MPRRDFPLAGAPQLRDRALSWHAEPGPPVEARLAATVMFVRDAGAGAGIEVFMLKRASTMAFAPSMHVFPGGGVDRRDAAEDVPWAGPGPAEWARRLGTDEDTARMLVTAALREVFEESGVLLAGPTPDSVLEDVRGEVWSSRRAALVDRELSFAEVLAHEGLVLRGDLLSYRAHWVTPEFEARRYDTWFFAATVPHGQDADDATSEAETAGWVRPDEALRQGSSGEVFMLPPTLVCLEELMAARDAESVLAESRPVGCVMPTVVETPEGFVLRAELP
jgi:8-oxo-dGTP pyrophosphatase MutT (NUDIX family)